MFKIFQKKIYKNLLVINCDVSTNLNLYKLYNITKKIVQILRCCNKRKKSNSFGVVMTEKNKILSNEKNQC